MKDLITTIASLLLLMIFVLQFSANQVTHLRIFQSGLAVESFRESMKSDGYASSADVQILQQELAEICGCSPAEVSVRVDGGQLTKGGLIPYEIIFPLQNLIIMGTALGILPEENQVEIREKGWVVSTYEEPDCNSGADSSDESGAAP